MPGYAYPVETAATQGGTSGSLKSVSYLITETTAPTSFYTATTKTLVSSVLATNNYGSILPVSLYVYRDSDEETYLTAEARVLKQKYMVQQLVSGDSRVDDSGDQQLNKYKVVTEFVLNVGDSLKATCPIEDEVVLTVTLKEGIQQEKQ